MGILDFIGRKKRQALGGDFALADTAMHDAQRSERKRAFKAITDPAAYAQIALHAPGDGLRLSAVEKISDELVLAGLAAEASDAEVRLRAVTQMRDSAALEQLTQRASDPAVVDKAKWGAAGLAGWIVVMPGSAGNSTQEQALNMAKATVCRLCDQSRCGEDAAAVLHPLDNGDLHLSGVCNNCADGENKLSLGLKCRDRS